ncbi:hypothetical protein EGJ86_19435 [Pseudomonas sp. o96-267]|nr:hypothetical protein EGJ86_19435 [Pseudomonas sp. o96-267]
MARRAPTGIHSEFKGRIALTIRAPEGDSVRANLLRRLVGEMEEHHQTGHLIEWVREALLERIAREVRAEQGVVLVEQAGAAIQPGVGRAESPKPRAVEPVRETVVPTPIRPHVSGASDGAAEPDAENDDEDTAPARLPAGLRSM